MAQKRIQPENNPLNRIEFDDLFTNPNLYLCGRPIKKVFENYFFECLNHYTSCGFCYGLSTIAMLLLKDDPTARLVQGYGRGLRENGTFRHCWVEIQRDGKWYVVDFAWFLWDLQPIPMDWYYSPLMVEADPLWTCEHREFWQRKLPNILFEKCSRANTSWVLPQIISCSTPPSSHDANANYGFKIHNVDYLQNPKVGRVMIPQVFKFNGSIIDSRIIEELIRPGLAEVSPSTKHKAEKHYQRFCKKIHAKEVYSTEICRHLTPSPYSK